MQGGIPTGVHECKSDIGRYDWYWHLSGDEAEGPYSRTFSADSWVAIAGLVADTDRDARGCEDEIAGFGRAAGDAEFDGRGG